MIHPDLDAEARNMTRLARSDPQVSEEDTDPPSPALYNHDESSGEEVNTPDEAPVLPDAPLQTVRRPRTIPGQGELANGLEGLRKTLGISESDLQSLQHWAAVSRSDPSET
jgi:hypothetical protein